MSTAKEYDDSPPRNGVIFFYTVLTVFVLIGVKFLLDSYFAKTMDSEIHDKVLTRGMEEVTAQRSSERSELDKTIQQAKNQYAAGGRAGLIASGSGRDKPEVQGWTQLGRKVEEAAPAQPAPTAPTDTPVPGATPESAAPTPGASPVSPAGRSE
jgi:hypothetical protein